MTRLAKAFMAMAVLGVIATAVNAQDALADQRKAQNKLLAMRAARVDAMRKLAERINGLLITSTTHVKDFVTENDQIETSMQAFLSGVREKGKPKFNEDGTCEVTMEVSLEELIVTLKQINNRHYKGDTFKAQDFEQMTVTNNIKILTETGMGAPRPELEEPPGAVAISKTEGLTGMSYMSGAARAYWLAHVTGQGRLMAVRAARVDGMRRLAERIKGVMISSNTSVKDFVAESDQIDVNMETFLVGAREARIRYHEDEPIVEVEMEVTLRTVYASLKQWGETHYHGGAVKMTQLEELSIKSQDQIIKETGMGIPPASMLKDVQMASLQAAMNMPDWVGKKIRAVGNAAIEQGSEKSAAQAKLMAFRGAELDARRKLAEELDGLMITSNTSVRDFVAQNDQIDTSMLTFQQGAHVVENSQKVMEDGTVEATVEIELRPLWDMIMYYEKKLSITVR